MTWVVNKETSKLPTDEIDTSVPIYGEEQSATNN